MVPYIISLAVEYTSRINVPFMCVWRVGAASCEVRMLDVEYNTSELFGLVVRYLFSV